MKKIIRCTALILSLSMLFLLCSCDDKKSTLEIDGIEGNTASLDYDTSNPVVAISVKYYGVIVIELYPDIAPNTVNNFISLVKSGFYDGNTIHRMQPGFVMQGGDPTGTGQGNPGYYIKGEFSANGFINPLKHTKYVVSMARGTPYDSGGCQFFIMLGDDSSLDGYYAAFGKVIDGFDVCDEIGRITRCNPGNGKLTQNLTITKAVVDTKGVNYPEPDKIK